jgi:ABC-type multidrug transport system ATPase subunit
MVPGNILQFQSVSFRQGGKIILSDINLAVKEHSIHTLLGENGAGKTTMMKLALGLVRPTSGQLTLLNGKEGNDRSYLAKLGSLIEGASIYDHLSVYENLSIHFLQRDIKRKKRMDEVIETVGLSDECSKKGRDLSMGMKQRLGIAMAILHEPKLLLLDEPINGLDPMGIVELRDLLISLNKKSGLTILLSSHILSEVDKISDSITLISKGEILFTGSIGEFRDTGTIEQSYLDRLRK